MNLQNKSDEIRIKTLEIQKRAKETRIASSLSPIEIFVALFYGNIIKFNPKNPQDKARDRLIISKGHGSICMYPILADLGYFDETELLNIGKKGSFLGSIPDPLIPGYETINGSLGHGLGVGAGMAYGLKNSNSNEKVVVLVGNGELQEGSNWEAIMFAKQYNLSNLIVIVDSNKKQMLDFSKNILDIEPMSDKFKSFGWESIEVKDGHNTDDLLEGLKKAFFNDSIAPKVVIANTIKGKGVDKLEKSPLAHVLSLSDEEIEETIKRIKNEK
ncbi:MAG: transketolase [Campylobacter lanienae]|uniref:transketolase n=1 Tax=Campylobacter lanienae TaxID=75658 RepID=UPI00242E5F12|nr:transketolase [Campylobacter lanienae]MDD7514230.1 transketolase [Campylobacter lanienae]